ncbi:Mg(2+) transport ATPase, P-type [Escherichia coli]|uniref:Mg(2+) transport ATPase, P-type n=1 Tax=Escherichia coli TaxID=562 RepID=A0A377DY84_ECOLX|nr:Mg(2+) transport ATPase, P-type [Escherichia coli]
MVTPKATGGEAALFALSVAVGLTPEMLPMIVTSTLARGAVKLSKQKVIVKHLDAIQNFGAMDILCTDKNWHPDTGQNCAGESYRYLR